MFKKKAIIKDEKSEFNYLILPRWKIVQRKVAQVNIENLNKKDKARAEKLKEEIEKSLKKNKLYGILIMAIYVLIYFSIISLVLSSSHIISLFDTIIGKLVNIIGTPVLIVIAYLLNRIMMNRFAEVTILNAELISIVEKNSK